jgi:YegS/Rv2252/BmrU family lipid kinase
MTSPKRIAAVVNPRSTGARTGKPWSEILHALEKHVAPITTRLTEASGHGIALARELLQEGFDLVIAVGGDGTINEVANGFLQDDNPIRPDACLGILPMGLGGDFQRTLGISSRIDEAIKILVTGVPLPIDVGKATFLGMGGATQTRYFINLVSFGMGGDVASRCKNLLSPVSGTAAFLWATFSTFLGYRGRRARMRLDKSEDWQSVFITNIAVGNGRYHGGGMQPCPTAILNDGIFEVTVIDYLSMFELIRDVRVLYSDNVYRHPKVHHFRAREIQAESDELTRLEIDGEPLGSLPLEIRVLPARLPVIVPHSSPLLAS